MEQRVFCIFAHNEQDSILECIHSIEAETDAMVFVLVNGCTDRTEDVVREYAKEHGYVKPVFIAVGDKANAWNVFVHDLNIESNIYYFVDGDCRVVPGSISAIETAYEKSQPNAFAGIPTGSGRAARSQSKEMLIKGGLAGNFYALTEGFVARIREGNIKIPVGTIGEDGFVGALAYWDLKPFVNKWGLDNVLVLEKACFTYPSLSPLSIQDIKLYYNRKCRYSIRHFQNEIIKRLFKRSGLDDLPLNIETTYKLNKDLMALSWRGFDTYFDLIAIYRMKRAA